MSEINACKCSSKNNNAYKKYIVTCYLNNINVNQKLFVFLSEFKNEYKAIKLQTENNKEISIK